MLWLSTHKSNEVMMVYTSYSSATVGSVNKIKKEAPQNKTSNSRIESGELWNCKPSLLAELSLPENLTSVPILFRWGKNPYPNFISGS